MSTIRSRRPLAALLALCAGLAACGGHGSDPVLPAAAEPRRQALAEGDEPSTVLALLRACLVDALAQQLPLTLAQAGCSVGLTLTIETGLDRPIAEAVAGRIADFDPASVQAACGAGNPELARGRWDRFSDYDLFPHEEYARQEQFKAERAGDAAAAAYWAGEASELAREQRRRDEEQPDADGPGGQPPGACAQVAQAAREILAECTRTGWERGDCAVLAARLKGCPDPRLAHIDPGSAEIRCGELPDPEAVLEAWKLGCEQQTKGGGCGGVVVFDGATPKVHGDLCADPRAWIDPASGDCSLRLTLVSPVPGQTIQDLVLFAFKRLGGPLVVLPLPGSSAPPCKVC